MSMAVRTSQGETLGRRGSCRSERTGSGGQETWHTGGSSGLVSPDPDEDRPYDLCARTGALSPLQCGRCLSLTAAALLGFEKQAADKARPLAQDVARKLRACDVNHADETYYRIDAKPAYASRVRRRL
jgi:hypothetical protein